MSVWFGMKRSAAIDFDHRMASVLDADLRGIGERRAHVAIAHGDRGQRRERVDLPNGARRGQDGARLSARDGVEQLIVQPHLDGVRLLFRADDLLFQHFQIGRDVALRVDQRLLADVVVRHACARFDFETSM